MVVKGVARGPVTAVGADSPTVTVRSLKPNLPQKPETSLQETKKCLEQALFNIYIDLYIYKGR